MVNERKMMSGDEAIARGAWEAGVTFATAYPGTPSTEILENISLYKNDIHCQWANNEKVAAEIAAGAAIGGLRALVSMKHVGLNVAADPIFTMGYAGVNGGLLVVSADDPGCHSSQNEQDNRLYAQHAKLGMLEPSDSQECKDFTIAAFELSEKFDLTMLMRMTTRVCHSKSVVEVGKRNDVGVKPYIRNPDKYTMLPSTARKRHIAVEENLIKLEEYAGTSKLNRTEINDSKIGVISSGISYMHAKEAFGDSVSYLKLGITYPFPKKLVSDFARGFEIIYVIEEGEPYLENAVRMLGFTNIIGKEVITCQGELNAQIVRKAFKLTPEPDVYTTICKAPARPPVLCAGCPHRGFFYAMSKHKKELVAVGDIGCYSLGCNAPLNGYDISICMGAGLSAPIGLAKALELQGDDRKVFGMVGDSTFYHSGLNSMIDAVHCNANVCLCVLDNSITAMTGHQENAGTAVDIMGYEVSRIELLDVIASTGIDEGRIRVVDPINQGEMEAAIQAAINTSGVFVIVTKSPCVLIKSVRKSLAGKHCIVDSEKCIGCGMCTKIGCPSISFENKKASVADEVNCTACGLCAQMCKFGAISKVSE